MGSFAFKATKWTLDLATKIIKADVRMHNHEAIQDDMAIVFVVNHFTRIETLLLPYEIHRHTGKEVWSLAHASLFMGRIGDYLRSVGNISTADPDRDKIMVSSLLSGRNPWIIFPEGAMIKDKKVIGPKGEYEVFHDGQRRPPHTGAAVLALRAEFYRHKLRCLSANPTQKGLQEVLNKFQLQSLEEALDKRTVIIPINITYYPLRSRENFLVRAARGLFEGISERMIEELSVEGTILSSESDIDITLGNPIDIREYLETEKFAPLLACGEGDLEALELDTRSLFNDTARDLTRDYMKKIYSMTTVNYDHIFSTIIRFQKHRKFKERAYRNRIFLCIYLLRKMKNFRLHQLLETTYRDIIYEDYSPKFHSFMDLCIREKWVRKEGDAYYKNFELKRGRFQFHSIRMEEITYVIANEVEPLPDLLILIKSIAQAPRHRLSEEIRKVFLKEDRQIYTEDHEKFFIKTSPVEKDGAPFLLEPKTTAKGGVVLVHGYLSCPGEIRPLASYLRSRGYYVYGVRLRGHGTSPRDLAERTWEDWYESLNRGYTVIKSLTDRIIVGGFSTGGALSLLAAGRKGDKIQSVFAINAPLQLRRVSARLAPSIVSMNTLIKRVKKQGVVEFVPNRPENTHLNYLSNPVSGVRELGRAMVAMEKELPKIEVPTLLLQGSRDPIVDPASGQLIFDKVGTHHKELTLLARDRHGIINGEGSRDVFERIYQFIQRSEPKKRKSVAK
ncbi:MAG: alpha/beta fold hydrolase [Candidatus Omnitrophica bacterium]|nr:alpha/beta fold hydrolase [Candidatus Omnitrophota bacterium]MCA9445471.1 alpha/beta fold hydrolase [Candidatus Omnitrophota bacterium]MCB9783901.1 alpha/beta fold hydrolase [Candidatus Omnitrophota bacterium]